MIALWAVLPFLFVLATLANCIIDWRETRRQLLGKK